jgi:uncharacterized protein
LAQLGKGSGAFEVSATEDMSEFSTEALKRYDAIMCFTSGELPMSGAEKTAFIDFVRSGGMVVKSMLADVRLSPNGIKIDSR